MTASRFSCASVSVLPLPLKEILIQFFSHKSGQDADRNDAFERATDAQGLFKQVYQCCSGIQHALVGFERWDTFMHVFFFFSCINVHQLI